MIISEARARRAALSGEDPMEPIPASSCEPAEFLNSLPLANHCGTK